MLQCRMAQGQRAPDLAPPGLSAFALTAPGLAAPALAALGLCPLLAACGDSPPGNAAWGFAALALVAVAVAGYLLGSTRAGHEQQQALRDCRAEIRLVAELRDNWLWQTDASHALVTWQPPGAAARQSTALFESAGREIAERLQAGVAFNSLRVASREPQEGCLRWELRGVPRHDELGRFAGYRGSARPTDAEDATAAVAAALLPTLDAVTEAALVVLDSARGWRLHHANPAARLVWPALTAGSDATAVLGALPPALAADLRRALQPAAAATGVVPPMAAVGPQRWQLQSFGEHAGARGVVLVQRAGPGLAGGSATVPLDAASTTGEQPVDMAESDNFSFTVSHDLRAPIRVVEGFTRIVKEDYGRLLDRVANDHLDRVLSAAVRMNLMIDALLTLARLSTQPLAHTPVNLSQLAGYVIDDLRRGAPEREVEINIEAGLSAHGDPTLLRLVLENLLGNAWKYSARSPRAQISLGTVPHGVGTAFVVRDNGAGFDMRSADRLFGLFQRLHSASEFAGHGVGLASVRRIVRRHGGEVWADSKPGHGAAFFFTLAG